MVEKICGIYKITSPSGKIYIGQSTNIRTRFNSYKGNSSSFKKQIRLYNSIEKYGADNHIFEVIEKCEVEELNVRERFWQDEFDVLNRGLNCILTTTETDRYQMTEESLLKRSEGKLGILNPMSKLILNTETGIYYDCIREACETYGINRNYMKDMLSGKAKNKTDCIYVDDYTLGKLPNTLYSKKERGKNKLKQGKEVVDYETKIIMGDTKEVAELLKIKESTFRSYLKGAVNNKTNYIYKEDLDRGLTPTTLCNNIIQSVKVIDFQTLQIYETMKEASKSYKVSVKCISDCLKDTKNSFLPIINFEKYCETQIYEYSPENINKRNNRVLNLTKGITYNSIKEASEDLGVSKSMLGKILNFQCYNYHNIIFERDYMNDLKPNEFFMFKKKPFIKVIDITTNIIYNSIRHACRELKLSKNTHEKIKNGNYENLNLRPLEMENEVCPKGYWSIHKPNSSNTKRGKKIKNGHN